MIEMIAIDQIILNLFSQYRVEWLSFIMLTITYMGGYLMIGGLTTLSIISLYIHNKTKQILALLITVGGSAGTVYLLKNLFYKARPFTEMIYTETSSSFPSGHATLAMALYGFLIYTIWKHEKHPLQKPVIWVLAILILLVGISRLYLGVHYLSDVLVGFVIGFIIIS